MLLASKKSYYGFGLAVFIVLIDQFSKSLAHNLLILYRPVSVLPIFNLTLAYNKGAAFSFLAQAGGWQFWLFIAVALIESTLISIWLVHLKGTRPLLSLGLGSILGGALGNMCDRILHGYVIDFMDFYFKQWHFATFNLADTAIFLGVCTVILSLCLDLERKSILG